MDLWGRVDTTRHFRKQLRSAVWLLMVPELRVTTSGPSRIGRRNSGNPAVSDRTARGPLIALFRDALALGLVPEHHDRLYGLAADPAMLLDRKAGWRPWAR